MINGDSPLFSVNDVFNAIVIHGNMLGDAMFYGSGAGKLPTASAVVADVVDVAKHLNRFIMTGWSSEKLEMIDISQVESRFFVRMKGSYTESLAKWKKCSEPSMRRLSQRLAKSLDLLPLR